MYAQLKSMAHRELQRSGGNTLDTTALVHELYVKLCSGRELEFPEVRQFFFYAARAMRHLLTDRARYRIRLKGGGSELHVPLTDETLDDVSINSQLALQLDAALDALEVDDVRAARVVELHYFAGLGLGRVGELLGLARSTVNRDWRYARSFLLAHLE